MADSVAWVLSNNTAAAACVEIMHGMKCRFMSLQETPLSVEVALESSHGSHTYASAVLEDIASEWGNFRATLTSNTTDPNARLALRLKVSWLYNRHLSTLLHSWTGDRNNGYLIEFMVVVAEG